MEGLRRPRRRKLFERPQHKLTLARRDGDTVEMMLFLKPRFVVMRNICSLQSETADVLNYTVSASTTTKLSLSGVASLENAEFDLAVVRESDGRQAGNTLQFVVGNATLPSPHEIYGRFVAEVGVRSHVFDTLVRNAIARRHFDSVAIQVMRRAADSEPEFMSYRWNLQDESPATLRSVVFHTTLSAGLPEYAG